MTNLRDEIVTAVASARTDAVLQPLEFGSVAQNELLFFLKPECFLTSTQDQQADAVDVVLKQFEKFGCRTAGSVMMVGSYLRANHVMDRHYGFINRASRNAKSVL